MTCPECGLVMAADRGEHVTLYVCSCGYSRLKDKGCGRCLCGTRETPCVAS